MGSSIFVLVLLLLLGATARLMRRRTAIVRIPARYENIRTLMSLLGPFTREARLGDLEVFECRLALDEACVNIIEHAYGRDATGEIEVALHAVPGQCVIRLTDFGIPYDPQNALPPSRGASLEETRAGGLGLYLMRELMDEVRYTVGPHGNSLVMIKRLPY